LLLLGPYPPPAGGVVSYLQAVFRHLPAGECAWYGYGDLPHDSECIHCVALQDYDPASRLWQRFLPRVVLDSSTVFLEYFDSRLLKRWLTSILLRRVRWVKVVHDSTLPARFAHYDRKQKHMIRLASRFVWRYVAVNEQLGQWLGKNVAPAGKVVVIPSLIDAPSVNTQVAPVPEFKRLADTSELVICAVGAMNPSYGFQDVVDAVGQLQADLGIQVGLALLHVGFDAHSGFAEQLRASFPGLLALSNLSKSQVAAIMRASDVTVRAVRSESYGLSRVESICLGTPVVATNTGETRGMYCYEFGDVSGLVRQLKRAMADGAREATASQGQQYVAEALLNRERLLQLLETAAV
jgi:glycosyltransferase involved in cell wall biosynthesis